MHTGRGSSLKTNPARLIGLDDDAPVPGGSRR